MYTVFFLRKILRFMVQIRAHIVQAIDSHRFRPFISEIGGEDIIIVNRICTKFTSFLLNKAIYNFNRIQMS